VPGDPLLPVVTYSDQNRGSGVQGYPRVYNFYATPGIKIFVKPRAAAHNDYEFFAGVRVGFQKQAVLTTYVKKLDTISTGFNSNSQFTMTAVENFSSTSFVIASKNFFIPIGVNFFTSPDKWISMSLGVEICPGITLDYQFYGAYERWTQKAEYEYNQQIDHMVLSSKPNVIERENFRTSRRILGSGFSGYISMPLAFYLRIPPRFNVLKGICAFAAIAPSYVYEWNRFGTGGSGLNGNLSVGFRYDIQH
jgi:hypothetical protein